jgi:pimeloyl-ACP methyl ester carboxylesterase
VPRARANGIELAYETFGEAGAEPLLLVMGLASQMIGWTEAFCEALAARGHRVVRFDNRDVGLSTKLEGVEHDSVLDAMRAAADGKPIRAPYLLRDMAADAAGLLDALGLERAHVVGASMGGMIGQTLAIEFPERVQTLVSIMSTTGEPGLPPPRPEALRVLLAPPPITRDEVIARALSAWKVIGSPGFPFDEARIRERAERSYDRCHHPEGVKRQIVAVTASGSRKEALAGVRAPTLVIHGEDDPLVPVECGRATARAIPRPSSWRAWATTCPSNSTRRWSQPSRATPARTRSEKLDPGPERETEDPPCSHSPEFAPSTSPTRRVSCAAASSRTSGPT